jgi:hypothetical protein
VAPDGDDIVYSTFLGGSGEDSGWGIAVDGAGMAYVRGQTASANFPTTSGAFQTTLHGAQDNFVTKVSADGSGLAYSTYLGGNGVEGMYGSIAVDASGAAYVTSLTTSADFPTTSNGFDPTHNGQQDVYVTRLNPAGSTLAYSTFLGGGNTDAGFGLAVDTAMGTAYVTGRTNSLNYPISSGAYDPTCGGCPGLKDGFVTKLDTIGPPTSVELVAFDGSAADTPVWPPAVLWTLLLLPVAALALVGWLVWRKS